jgi:hypothetical protein
MFMPRDPASSDTSAAAPPLLGESTPPPSSDPDPVAVRPASLATEVSADRRSKTPKPVAAAPASAAGAEVPVLPSLSFNDVKMLTVNGTRTSTLDVVVQFSGADVTVQLANGKAASATLPYHRITKATYANGRDPKWDPAFSAPAEKLDVSGLLGRARRWLVLQGVDSYVILRLDGSDWRDVVKALEDRARIVIDRPTSVKDPG